MAEEDVVVRISLRNELSPQLRQIRREVADLQRDLRGLGGSIGAGARQTDTMSGSTRNLTRNMADLHQQILGVATGLTNPLLTGLKVTSVGFAGATVAAGAFGIKALSAFDQSQTALDTLTGSVAAGHGLMRQLQQYDLSTAFDSSQIFAATQTLEQFNVTGSQTVPVLKALGDVAALSNDPSGNLSRMALAIGQISSAGVLRAQDLNQLVQAGFPAYTLAAQTSGLTPQQLRKQMDSGGIELPADKFLGAITAYQGPLARYKGAAVNQGTKSLGGALSNLTSSVQQAGVQTALPYKDQLTGEVRGVTDGLVGIVKGVGPDFFHLMTTLGDFLVKELPHAQPVLQAIFQGIDRLVTATAPAVDKVLAPLGGEVGAKLTDTFTQLEPVMPDIVDAFVHLILVLPDFLLLMAQMIQLTQPVVQFADALLSTEGGRKVIAALLVTLLGYRALTAIVGPIIATTNALRGLAGAQAASAAGAGGRIGAAGAAGRGALGLSGAGVAAAAGGALAVVGGLEGWKAYSDHHQSQDELIGNPNRQPDWWDKLQGKIHGKPAGNYMQIQKVDVHANDAAGGQRAADAFYARMNEQAAIQEYAQQRNLRR